MTTLQIIPMTLKKANDFVALHHRHNGRTQRNGGKFAVGIEQDGELVGVAIVGNPLSATFMDGKTAEVTRCCVLEDAALGCCSKLYAACWRAWRAMGGHKLITYTLQSESGASLRGAGWKIIAEVKPTREGWHKKDHLVRKFQPVQGELKFRWEVHHDD